MKCYKAIIVKETKGESKTARKDQSMYCGKLNLLRKIIIDKAIEIKYN